MSESAGAAAKSSLALDDLDDAKFVKVAQFLEANRASKEAQALLDASRSRLIALRPPRPLSLQRAFCTPLENLLRSGAEPRCAGAIERAVTGICWTAAEQAMAPPKHDALKAALLAAGSDEAFLASLEGAEFLGILKSAMSDDGRLGRHAGEIPLEPSLTRIRSALGVFAELLVLQKLMPAPRPSFATDKDRAAFGAIVTRARARSADGARLLVQAMAAQMGSSAALVDELQTRDFKLGEAETAFVKDALAADLLEEIAAQVGAARTLLRTDISATLAVSTAQRLAIDVACLLRAAPARNPAIASGTDEGRDIVRALLQDKAFGAIEKDILLPFAAAGSDPGIAVTPALPKVREAENSARLLRRCLNFSAPIGLDAQVSAKLKMLADALKKSVLEHRDRLKRSGPSDQEARDRNLSIVLACRIVEIVRGPSEAAALLRSAR